VLALSWLGRRSPWRSSRRNAHRNPSLLGAWWGSRTGRTCARRGKKTSAGPLNRALSRRNPGWKQRSTRELPQVPAADRRASGSWPKEPPLCDGELLAILIRSGRPAVVAQAGEKIAARYADRLRPPLPSLARGIARRLAAVCGDQPIVRSCRIGWPARDAGPSRRRSGRTARQLGGRRWPFARTVCPPGQCRGPGEFHSSAGTSTVLGSHRSRRHAGPQLGASAGSLPTRDQGCAKAVLLVHNHPSAPHAEREISRSPARLERPATPGDSVLDHSSWPATAVSIREPAVEQGGPFEINHRVSWT